MYKKINNVVCNQIVLDAIKNYKDDIEDCIISFYKYSVNTETLTEIGSLNQALVGVNQLAKTLQEDMKGDHSLIVQDVVDNIAHVGYKSLESYIYTRTMYGGIG